MNTTLVASQFLRITYTMSTKSAFVNWLVIGLLLTVCSTASASQPQKEAVADPACRVKAVTRAADGIGIVSPDGKSYLFSKKDASGIYQVYVGKVGSKEPTCISSPERPGGPKVDRHKMQVNWHPSGKWIVMAAERDEDTKPFFAKRGFPGTQGLAEGLL